MSANSAVRPVPDALLVDIADYAGSHRIAGGLAYETAHHCLMDILAAGFRALKVPACTNLLGPVVPGATLIGGARVPGTSYELDPITAAFNIGCMIHWVDHSDAVFLDGWGHPSSTLGGILAIADYLSRGGTPVTVRDVFTGMIKAQEIQGVLALESRFERAGLDHVLLVSVASTAVVTAMWGGSQDQIVDAVSNAWMDGGALRSRRDAPQSGSHRSRAAGQAAGRAVRHALHSLKGGTGYPAALTARSWGFQDVFLEGHSLALARPLGSHVMENMASHESLRGDGIPILVKKFETSVAAHFSARQGESIRKMFSEPAALADMPVSHFVAKLVSAG